MIHVSEINLVSGEDTKLPTNSEHSNQNRLQFEDSYDVRGDRIQNSLLSGRAPC